MLRRNKDWFGFGLVFFVLVFFLAPRLIGLGEFLIVDEPARLMASANFYYAVTHFDFANAAYTYHPAVTTMWLGSTVMLLIFPEYRGLGQGYLNQKSIDGFFIEYGVQPLDFIVALRFLQVLVIAVLLLLVYFLLQKLLDRRLAFIVTIFIAGEPFFLGHSRVINHEGLLSQFLLISIFTFMLYIHDGKKFYYLLFSGIAAGLANLTKSSGIVLIPLMPLMLLEDGWLNGLKEGYWEKLKTFLVWALIMVVTYVALWPAMWVVPEKMIFGVYGEALSYFFRGVGVIVEEASTTNLSTIAELKFHLSNILLRTTPILWLGTLLAFLGVLKRGFMQLKERLVLINMVVLALGILLIYSMAGGRNSLHYFLLIYVAFSIVAALGYAGLLKWGAEKLKQDEKLVSLVGTVALAAGFLILTLGQYPYYYTYHNAIIPAISPEKDKTYGYAEGLELAAEYLSAKENAEDLTAVSWYARGPFSYYFPGQAEYIYLDDNVDADFVKTLRYADYLVIYYPQQLRRNMPANLMQAIAPYTPEKIIKWNGDPYVGIYDLQQMPTDFFDALP